MHRVGGIEMECPVKHAKEGREGKARESERKAGVRPVTSSAARCVWSWQGTQLRVTLLVGAAKLPLPVLFIHT